MTYEFLIWARKVTSEEADGDEKDEKRSWFLRRKIFDRQCRLFATDYRLSSCNNNNNNNNNI